LVKSDKSDALVAMATKVHEELANSMKSAFKPMSKLFFIHFSIISLLLSLLTHLNILIHIGKQAGAPPTPSGSGLATPSRSVVKLESSLLRTPVKSEKNSSSTSFDLTGEAPATTTIGNLTVVNRFFDKKTNQVIV